MIDPTRSRDMLAALGIEIETEQGDEVSALCPMHKARTGKADHNPSWWFNTETGAHICFSCGYTGSVLNLVIDVLDMHTKWGLPNYEEARAWLADFEMDLVTATSRMNRDEYQQPLPKPVPMTEARLAVFSDPPQWALDNRNLTLDACTRFGVLWDDKETAWIAPLRDPESFKLMGFQMKGEGTRLFRNRPLGIAKSTTLFGLDAFTGGRMIVVESPLDAVRMLSAGVPGAVATCGAKISDAQIALMILHADSLVLAMDNPSKDEAGRKSLEAFYTTTAMKGVDFRQFSYAGTDAKDPGDMTDDQIRHGVEKALSSVWGIDRLLAA